MIKFACSNCGQSIRVDDKYAGKKGKCPKCKTSVVVPGRSSVIRFRCEHCGAKIKVPDRYAGKKGKCPTCQKSVVVPAARSEAVKKVPKTTITCSVCDQAFERTEGSADQFVECPACGAVLDPSSGEAVSAPESTVPPETDEELDEETTAGHAPASGRFNRRLMILASTGAVVAIVALIGVFWFLRSPETSRTRVSTTRSQPVHTGETEVASETAANESSPVEPTASPAMLATVSPEPAEVVRLEFHPSPGSTRKLAVTTQMTISSQEQGSPQVDITNTQSFTVGLEARAAQADGAIPVTVTLQAIRVTAETQGHVLGEYDSTKPQSEDDSMAGFYVPFVGQRFTMRLSQQGEIIDPGLDELFLAVAAAHVEAEDDMMREQLGEKATEAIQRADQRFGSRRARTQALEKQFEESPLFGARHVRGLLDHLVAPLPAEPVRSGDHWSDPIGVFFGARIEMPGTYTLEALEEDSGTIIAEGQRSAEDEPFIYQSGSATVSNKLAGSSHVTLTVSRRRAGSRAGSRRQPSVVESSALMPEHRARKTVPMLPWRLPRLWSRRNDPGVSFVLRSAGHIPDTGLACFAQTVGDQSSDSVWLISTPHAAGPSQLRGRRLTALLRTADRIDAGRVIE